MQNIPYDIIGTMLHQIWHGNPDAAPPIHFATEDDSFRTYVFLGIQRLTEHIDDGEELPSAILVRAYNMQRGGGPYFLYWVEDDRPELADQVKTWKTGLGERPVHKITAMGIGNSLF